MENEMKQTLEKAFSNFGISLVVESSHVGSSVTTYAVRLGKGVRVKALRDMENDISLALGINGVLFDYLFGGGLIGIQVPNAVRGVVDYNSFASGKGLEFIVGQDVIGGDFRLDLAKLPHLLVAGQTGSGKSVVLNCLISSLIDANDPMDLHLVLVDPKRVEFSTYKNVPHLREDIVTEVGEVVGVLESLVEEMENRYAEMEQYGVRSIDGLRACGIKYPKIVLVVDELGDIMLREKKNVEDLIVRLGQKSRACGIHLVLATQRPSCDVVTGLIKANIPARLVCKVASSTDSVVVLGQGGAENLLGKGDMLFSDGSGLKRVQGAWISDTAINDVILRSSAVSAF